MSSQAKAERWFLLAWGFIALIAVPLLTVGVYKITRGPPRRRASTE